MIFKVFRFNGFPKKKYFPEGGVIISLILIGVGFQLADLNSPVSNPNPDIGCGVYTSCSKCLENKCGFCQSGIESLESRVIENIIFSLSMYVYALCQLFLILSVLKLYNNFFIFCDIHFLKIDLESLFWEVF